VVDLSPIIAGFQRGDFNPYKEAYSSLSFQELKTLYTEFARYYPLQQSANLAFFEECFKILCESGKPLKVLELGGYDGWLASYVLKRFPIEKWLNAEIIPHKPVPELASFGEAYQELVLEKQFWETEWRDFDVFVSSDAIEHFSNEEVGRIFDSVRRIPVLALQVDIREKRHSWAGSWDTHICTLTWADFEEILRSRSYVCKQSPKHQTPYLGLWLVCPP
jgi:hypothetical protein